MNRLQDAFNLYYVVMLYAILLGASSLRYVIDDTEGLGRTFDGIGGISGGGATSRLLVSYPAQELEAILDYLFRPNFGASLHILKVEIGGDSESSDGSEASHMHNSWDENYNRGYEWWLMLEAKKRNPDILLYGLPWAFPGWVGAGSNSPYTNVNVTADYIVRWIRGARDRYKLTIDFIGIWNEKPYSIDYIVTLRKMLDSNGFQHVKIVASDNKWQIAGAVLKNSTLASVLDIIGVHYPGTLSTNTALQTGKQLWSSEDYSTFNDDVGAGCWARILNQNYVNGNMSATISWNLIAAYYSGLSYTRTGLMTAMEPWSGHYVVESPIWITAHTAQFTKPGWKYLQHGHGVGKLDQGGSYVSFTNGGSQLTIVIETMTHDHSICIRPFLPRYAVEKQNVTFILNGSFATLTSLNVWYSKLNFDGSPDILFKKLNPIPVTKGVVYLELGLDEVYTLSTVSTGMKGTSPAPPPSQPFPLPYEDSFESYHENGEPDNFAQQVGSFEVITSTDANRTKVLRQMVLEDPIDWCPFINLAFPMDLIGSVSWTDIYVEVEARTGQINGSDSVFIASRIDQGGCQTFGARGYYFFLFPGEERYELTNDLSRTITLKSGAAQCNGDWNKLGLKTTNGVVVGYLNDKILFNVTTSNKPTSGFAGLGSGSFGISDFDNFRVTGINTTFSYKNKFHKNKDTLYFKPRKPEV